MSEGIKDAIARVQRLRDGAEIERARHDSIGEGLTSDGSWKDWESEAAGDANEREVETFDRVLDVLQIIFHGGTPAQGAADCVTFAVNGVTIIAPIGEPLDERRATVQEVMSPGGMITATHEDGKTYGLWLFADGYKARALPEPPVALASDFVADADGRDARFTRTDDGEDDPKPIERPKAIVEMEPWELDALAAICHNSKTKTDSGLWMRDRVLDKQVRNRLGKA